VSWASDDYARLNPHTTDTYQIRGRRYRGCAGFDQRRGVLPDVRCGRQTASRSPMSPRRKACVPTELVLAARSGDAGAISGLLKIAQPDIRRYAKRHCRKASDIDDAVQESLLLLYRRLDSLRAVESFSYWLFQIVDRVCLRLGRRLLGITNSIDELENDVRFSSATDSELRLDLSAAIESLPSHYREVIIMRDIGELTIEEIGDRLVITRQAAKAQLHRARALVREYMLK
jgi:RNA polymerase sigma factor (sigma-70 family)